MTDKSSENKQIALGFGKKNDSQQTPKDLYEELDREFHFEFDPCPLGGEESDIDGLQIPWKKCNFVNPPYSNVMAFVVKSVMEMGKGNTTVLLIPARVSSRYWHHYVFKYASEIRYLQGKLKFGGYDKGLPIPLAIVVMKPKEEENTTKITKKMGKYNYVSYKP
jgi:site-specific DNA-methyltransferase (adenine-specific)